MGPVIRVVLAYGSHSRVNQSAHLRSVIRALLCDTLKTQLLTLQIVKYRYTNHNPIYLTGEWTKCMLHMLLAAQMTIIMRKVVETPTFCICENKVADQLRGNREADLRLCFRLTGSTNPLLPKSEISSLFQLHWLCNPFLSDLDGNQSVGFSHAAAQFYCRKPDDARKIS